MPSSKIENLINELCRLPGFGIRSATRIAYFLLTRPKEDLLALIKALQEFSDNVKQCSTCFNVSESDPCPICADPNRDKSIICVVEEPQDLAAIETAGIYWGVYHVLGGVLNALEGIGPEKLHIEELLSRVDAEDINEIILAINPTPEGETTAAYIAKKLSASGVIVSTLAQGLSSGSDLEFANKRTIRQAMENRRKI